MSTNAINIRLTYPPQREAERLITKSEKFRGTLYEIKNGQMVIWTRSCGVLTIDLRNVSDFAQELREVGEIWKCTQA